MLWYQNRIPLPHNRLVGTSLQICKNHHYLFCNVGPQASFLRKPLYLGLHQKQFCHLVLTNMQYIRLILVHRHLMYRWYLYQTKHNHLLLPEYRCLSLQYNLLKYRLQTEAQRLLYLHGFYPQWMPGQYLVLHPPYEWSQYVHPAK